MLQGKLEDYGDLILQTRWIVKGRHITMGFHVSAPRERPDGWTPGNTTRVWEATSKGAFSMDLQADKEFDLTPTFKDEMENVVPVPAGTDVIYTVDTNEFVELIEIAGEGVTVGALGTLGQTVVHAECVLNGRLVTSDTLVTTVAGDAERMEMVAGPARERTPDA